ncbi:hypothetical protein E2F50_21660 [Rhizobium deserti]|uniref:Uncharacterized protein n=1 Tax=Rhizobium deserti TaxID=2547961 RepID=A0A4R5U6F1_9HYPH|nr:hypothetical protein [Rhizobium deserti]TDK29812.1 hypothetical protein E2F50_21660 [Rhizobium deserti]
MTKRPLNDVATFDRYHFTAEEHVNELKAGMYPTIEVLYERNGITSKPAAHLLQLLKPSSTRSGIFRQDTIATYSLSGSDIDALGPVLEQVQGSLPVRAACTNEPFPEDVVPVTAHELTEALNATRHQFPEMPPPRLGTRELLVGTLDRVSCLSPGTAEVFDNGGRQTDFEFLKNDRFGTDPEQNIFLKLSVNGCVTGIAMPFMLWIENGNYAAPSFIVEGSVGPAWVVFLVYGRDQELDRMREELVQHLDLPGADLAGLICPLPCGQYRLSKESAQVIEFDSPFGFYAADELLDVFLPPASTMKARNRL